MSTYSWIITKDHIADQTQPEGTNLNAKGVIGPHNATPKTRNIIAFGKYSEMYDDDGNLYDDGYLHDLTGNAEGSEPLDDFGTPNAGCVQIKYRSKTTGEMETL